jgi:hypothetical protein
MATCVFVSYRRSDSRQVAGRLRDKLSEAFGATNVFLDVDSLEFGSDFRTQIRDTLRAVDAVVALIGPGFSPGRLAEPNDFVRMELVEALAQGKPILPVLVEDARVPGPDELPEELEVLAYLNTAPLRHDPDFHRDATRLIESLGRLVRPASKQKQFRRPDVASATSKADGARRPTATRQTSPKQRRSSSVPPTNALDRGRRQIVKGLEKRGFWQFSKNVFYQSGDVTGDKPRVVFTATRVRLEKPNPGTFPRTWKLWQSFSLMDGLDAALAAIDSPKDHFLKRRNR